jgi:uncharacterized membrane protein YkoI
MKTCLGLILATLALAQGAGAQQKRVTIAGGEVARNLAVRADLSRLSSRIPGVDAETRARIRVSGDSAQRIAIADYDWKGRVHSVEVDEEDSRLFWDVKIIPDTSSQTIVRYRVDAATGGILSIREFGGVRGLRAPRQ